MGINKTRIWAISDTYGMHKNLTVPKDIDIACFVGGAGITHDPSINSFELANFLKWFNNIDATYKIFMPGAYDTSYAAKILSTELYKNISFLVDEFIIVRKLKFYATPYTKKSNWAYTKKEKELKEKWENISEDTDILLSYSPPLGILDKTNITGYSYGLETLGNKELRDRVFKVKPKLHIFGKAVDRKNILNSGSYKSPEIGTIFMNVTCKDDKQNLVHNGIVIDV